MEQAYSTGILAGTGYAYSVTDANNCASATGTFSVVQPPVITVSNVSQSTIACNGGTATVTITASGGTGGLSYTFNGVTNTTGIFTGSSGRHRISLQRNGCQQLRTGNRNIQCGSATGDHSEQRITKHDSLQRRNGHCNHHSSRRYRRHIHIHLMV